MTLTLLTPIILMITAMIVIVSALSSRRSGLIFSSIHFGISVACAFLAAALSSAIAMICRASISDIFSSIGFLDFLYSNSTQVINVVERLLVILSTLVFFIPIFILLVVIFRLVLAISLRSKIARLKGDSDGYLSENATYLQKNDKLFATLVGIVCGVFISIAILSPVTGALRSFIVIDRIIDDGIIASEDEVDEQVRDTLDTLEYYSNDFAVTVYDACGGRALFNVTTTFIYYGDVSNLSAELRAFDAIDVGALRDCFASEDTFNEDFIRQFNSIIDLAEESPTIRMILTVCASGLAENWINGDAFMSISRPEVTTSSTARDIFDEMLKVLAKSDEETVCEDVESFITIVDVLLEYSDILSTGEYQSIADALVNDGLLERLKQALESNPRMRAVSDAADELLMRMVAEEISDYSKFTNEMREDLFEKIAETLTDTSGLNYTIRNDVVLEEVQTALEEYGVYTNAELCSKISEILVTEIGSTKGKVDSDDVRAYFDAFLTSIG